MRTWLSRVLVALIFAFTAIAAVNTLAMIAFARGRELAVLRLVGASPRQIARMSRWEAGARRHRRDRPGRGDRARRRCCRSARR